MKSKKLIIAVMFILSSWNGVIMADSEKNADVNVTNEMITKVKNMKIFFGHQSVGFNILDGIQDITSDLNIVETKIMPDNGSFFSHARVGENIKPELKINDFKNIIESNNSNIDVAFLKLCYVDITAETDVKSLFHTYKTVFSKLKNDYPNIQFVHLTSPLTIVQSGPKAMVKRLLGRDVWGEKENIKRQEYNELIRTEYANTGMLFDLAKIESTKPNGDRVQHETDGFTFFGIVPAYTDDGGHLNETGRRIVAAQLIRFISEIEIK